MAQDAVSAHTRPGWVLEVHGGVESTAGKRERVSALGKVHGDVRMSWGLLASSASEGVMPSSTPDEEGLVVVRAASALGRERTSSEKLLHCSSVSQSRSLPLHQLMISRLPEATNAFNCRMNAAS